MKVHTPLIIGNWKMNPATLGNARKLFLDTRKAIGRKKLVSLVAVAPPFPFLSEMERLSPSQRIGLSAQDVFFESIGAHTGEVSLPMLKSVGVTSVIIGHSERRAAGETDEEIYKDVQAVFKSGITAIVCVGEKARDEHGNYFGIVEAQMRSALRDVPKTKLAQLVIAYEPVWAIGTGNHATPEDVHEMKLFIQKIIADQFGRKAIKKVRVLYGGSVKSKNAQELFEVGQVDGFLIGGASLKPKEFAEIIHIAETYAKKVV
ncbi:MAG: triosephosphate isomerase [Acidimicrobiales bacterium]|jgi:triosephosphate isomerase